MAEYVAQGDGWTSPFDDESDNAQFAQPLMCDDHPIIRAAYAEANAPQSSMMMSADFVASELSMGALRAWKTEKRRGESAGGIEWASVC